MENLDIEYYRENHNWLDEDFGPFLSKAAVVCLASMNHSSGVTLSVKLMNSQTNYELIWNTQINEQRTLTLPNDDELTQKGAECISLLIAKEKFNYPYFITARKGTRVDFWLQRSIGVDLDARLEVSGIRSETSVNTISRRMQEKRHRLVLETENRLPTFISIVEFSRPKAEVTEL